MAIIPGGKSCNKSRKAIPAKASKTIPAKPRKKNPAKRWLESPSKWKRRNKRHEAFPVLGLDDKRGAIFLKSPTDATEEILEIHKPLTRESVIARLKEILSTHKKPDMALFRSLRNYIINFHPIYEYYSQDLAIAEISARVDDESSVVRRATYSSAKAQYRTILSIGIGAIREYRQAIKSFVRFSASYGDKIWVHFKKGEYSEAVNIVDAVLEELETTGKLSTSKPVTLVQSNVPPPELTASVMTPASAPTPQPAATTRKRQKKAGRSPKYDKADAKAILRAWRIYKAEGEGKRESFLATYADDNGMTPNEARKMLQATERDKRRKSG